MLFEMIDKAMNLLISCCDDADELKEHYKNLRIKEIDFTHAGFFCCFSPGKNCQPLKAAHKNFGTVYGKINDIPIGFILFFDNNYIVCLECYEETDDDFMKAVIGNIYDYDVYIKE